MVALMIRSAVTAVTLAAVVLTTAHLEGHLMDQRYVNVNEPMTISPPEHVQ